MPTDQIKRMYPIAKPRVARHRHLIRARAHDRTSDGSWRLLEHSLELLKTDHIDLWQIHALSRMQQVDEVFTPGGAIEALIEVHDQGIVRHLGISGHADPVHRQSLFFRRWKS